MRDPSRTPRVISVRPMTREDIQTLSGRSAATVIQRIRDSHHMIAMLAAAGLSTGEIASRCGFSYNRVSTLRNVPAMVDLIAQYREKVTDQFLSELDVFRDLGKANMVKAQRMIADRLDDAEEGEVPALPIRELVAISSDLADRFGYGKHSTSTNVNVDFAAKLEDAIRRSGKTIEIKDGTNG